MHHSVVLLEKPMPHLELTDWHARVNQLRNTADARCSDAFDIRSGARLLRNETRIESDRANFNSNKALSGRISELKRWRESITSTVQRIEQEIRKLKEEKALAERELADMHTPISVIAECLTIRDCRLGTELTYDDADTQIKNELAVVENNQRLLADQCQNAWLKLNRLEEVKFKLNLEIGNKAKTEVLDAEQLDMNTFTARITYKPDPLRNPKNSFTYEEWLEHTKNMKQLAESELADTYAIRETLFVCRQKARNMLLSQKELAELSIRKRIFETQRARNDLEWKQKKVQNEVERVVCEIKTLEQALRDKINNFKLAQTRLENRAQRPGVELCLDDVHEQLCREMDKLRDIQNRIMDKINEAKTNYNMLELQAHKIDVDLENKRHSLMTDQRALELHQSLKSGEPNQPNKQTKSPSAQTERNILLTEMEHTIPKN